MAEKPRLRLYNTLTRTKEDFAPLDPQNVRMYVCGPTVYDYAHIGNARPVIVFDVLYRLLRHLYGADHVTYVRNVTDVDDKINARALRDHPGLPLNEAIRAVTEKTEAQFKADAAALGCLEPTVEPRATEFVLPRADGKSDMKSLIQTLISRGHAYEAKGEILFDISSMADYGRLSNRRIADQQAGARVAVDAHKKNPGDFVLWKESSENEPGWDATFDLPGGSKTIRGRPGWHIECSAMSAAYLGETFDIHGGGLDLIFPHHENEIAQSRCAHGTDTMANIWMHNGFLQVEGRKMAKSEGNFVTIEQVLSTAMPLMAANDSTLTTPQVAQLWNGLAARYSMLQTKYREPLDWTAQRLAEASNELVRWYGLLRDVNHDTDIIGEATEMLVAKLADDLDTWSVITDLRHAYNTGDSRSLGEGMALLGLLNGEFLKNGHLLFDRSVESADPNSGLEAVTVDTDQIDARIRERLEELNAKNFAEADRIRDDLLAQGIQLKDSKDSETGERVTTWEVKR